MDLGVQSDAPVLHLQALLAGDEPVSYMQQVLAAGTVLGRPGEVSQRLALLRLAKDSGYLGRMAKDRTGGRREGSAEDYQEKDCLEKHQEEDPEVRKQNSSYSSVISVNR